MADIRLPEKLDSKYSGGKWTRLNGQKMKKFRDRLKWTLSFSIILLYSIYCTNRDQTSPVQSGRLVQHICLLNLPLEDRNE